ncbi:MAG: hypothetical protein NW201_07650, partial [Gemmatimonadales bacterium]|nr:hypothetical protein [Gemmatimonadales bacterium]
MRNYWVRIFLGAFGIFAVGMVFWTIVRKGKEKVKETVAVLVDSSDPITLPLPDLPVREGTRQLGRLTTIRIVRSSPTDLTGVDAELTVADSSYGAAAAKCWFVPEGDGGIRLRAGPGHQRGDQAVVCVDSAVANGPGMVRFGVVHVAPAGTERPFMMPDSAVAGLRDAARELASFAASGSGEAAATAGARARLEKEVAVAQAAADSLRAEYEALERDLATITSATAKSSLERNRARLETRLKRAEGRLERAQEALDKAPATSAAAAPAPAAPPGAEAPAAAPP